MKLSTKLVLVLSLLFPTIGLAVEYEGDPKTPEQTTGVVPQDCLECRIHKFRKEIELGLTEKSQDRNLNNSTFSKDSDTE